MTVTVNGVVALTGVQVGATKFQPVTLDASLDTTLVVPANCYELEVDGAAAGGGGGAGGTVGGGGGGGAGQIVTGKRVYVTPGQTLYIHVGARGTNGFPGGASATSADDTWIRINSTSGPYLLRLIGGTAGGNGSGTNGGAGGNSGILSGGATTTGSANSGSNSNTGPGLSLPNMIRMGSSAGSGSVTGNGGASGAAAQYAGSVSGGSGAGGGGSGGVSGPPVENGFTNSNNPFYGTGGTPNSAGTFVTQPGFGGAGGGINAVGSSGATGFLRIKFLRF